MKNYTEEELDDFLSKIENINKQVLNNRISSKIRSKILLMAKSTLRSLKNKNVKTKKFRKPKKRLSNVKKRQFC